MLVSYTSFAACKENANALLESVYNFDDGTTIFDKKRWNLLDKYDLSDEDKSTNQIKDELSSIQRKVGTECCL